MATEEIKPMDTLSTPGNTAPTPMSQRNCYALDTLLAEVRALFPGTRHEVHERNPRGVALAVLFDTEGKPGLNDLLLAAAADSRILDVESDVDAAMVRFRSSARTQDSRDTFNLAAAWAVMAHEWVAEGEQMVADDFASDPEAPAFDDEDDA